MTMTKPSHLAPVPAPAPTDSPAPRPYDVRVELPAGGRTDVDGLLRELARVAFPKALVGFTCELLPGIGMRCNAIVRVGQGLTPDAVERGRRGILGALFALGVIRPARPAEPPADPAPAPAEDGAPSQAPAPQSSPSSAE